jgi:hypothetical protein
MNKHALVNEPAFRKAPTALERVASEIVGIASRMEIKILTGGDHYYHFRLDIEETDKAEKIRAANYLNHKMRSCMARNKESLIPLVEGYLQMNGGSTEYFSEDLLEEWIAGEFEKNKNSMAKEYTRYSRYPYVVQDWEKLENPLLEGIKLGKDDIGALILCPYPIALDEKTRELFSENINYHAGVHLYENFRRVKSVFYADGLMEKEDMMQKVDSRIRKDLEEGKVIIRFFELQKGLLRFRPQSFEGIGL